MKRLTPAFLKAVGDYMLVTTPLARADVCLVFGNNAHPDHLAAQAADLYHRGFFDLVVVSGGPLTDDGRTEAQRMRDVLLAKGVPAAAILVEDKARNTGENVIFSKQLLDQKVGLGNIKSVLAIGHIHAARRFLMTLEQHWPAVTKMFTTTNCYGVPLRQWHKHPGFRRAVLSEYNKIAAYAKKHFIREIDLPQMRKKIKAQPRPGTPGRP